MVSGYRLSALIAFVGLGASLACSAQGDQTANNVSDGAGGSTTGTNNGGSIPIGGTSSTNGGAGPIPVGGTSGVAGAAGSVGGPMCIGSGTGLRAVLRDFQPTWMGVMGHPDFEPQVSKPTAINFFNMIETGIVKPDIDPNTRKPIYNGPPNGTNTTMGQAYFPSWFIDTPGANVSIDYTLTFEESPPGSGLYVFDQSPFLPVDDGAGCPVQPQSPCLLGMSRNYPTHNYALTLEFHTIFTYKPGLSFRFAGDDDVWVFVNGKLAIDLGGIHQRAEATLNLDSANPPLQVGAQYILDFFWAERHVTASNFRVETSLDFIDCSIDVPK